MRLWFVFVGIIAVALVAAGCDRPSGAATVGQPTTVSTAILPPVAAATRKPAIAKIVFVGKEHACDCTRRAIDDSWKALQAGLGATNRIPIERLYMDTQADQVAVYRGRRPFMALPAIYFLDQTGSIVELLQGEVSAVQVRAVLK